MLLLVLTIEVHSPSMARLDRTIEWQLQMARGAAEYCFGTFEAHAVGVHTSGAKIARVEHQQLAWQPSPTTSR